MDYKKVIEAARLAIDDGTVRQALQNTELPPDVVEELMDCVKIGIKDAGFVHCGACNKTVPDWEAHEKDYDHKRNVRKTLVEMADKEQTPEMKALLMQMAYEKTTEDDSNGH